MARPCSTSIFHSRLCGENCCMVQVPICAAPRVWSHLKFPFAPLAFPVLRRRKTVFHLKFPIRRRRRFRTHLKMSFSSKASVAVVRTCGEAQKAANTTRSKVRARVEHVFGDQKNGMGAELVRTIGIVRARCKIGMTNLVYNMRRFIILERMGR